MRISIKEVGKIGTGVYVKTHQVGNVFYLLARDFDNYRNLNETVEPNAVWNESLVKHVLYAGDVLVAAKGDDNFAAVYDGKVKPAVASSIFLVIRNIDKKKIIPEYLVWLINHPSNQKYLGRKAKGTSISSINKTVLEDMIIDVPTIKVQQAVLRFAALRMKEKQLKSELEYYKELYIESKMLNAIKWATWKN